MLSWGGVARSVDRRGQIGCECDDEMLADTCDDESGEVDGIDCFAQRISVSESRVQSIAMNHRRPTDSRRRRRDQSHFLGCTRPVPGGRTSGHQRSRDILF